MSKKDFNEQPASLQLLVILQIGVGLSTSLASLLVPIYTGFSTSIAFLVLSVFFLGLGIAQLGFLLGVSPSKKLWWTSFLIFSLILIVLIRHLFFAYLDFPTEKEMVASGREREVARIFLNSIIFLIFFVCWIQLLRHKSKLTMK